MNIATISLMALASLSASGSPQTASIELQLKIHSKAIAKNRLGDPATQSVRVYLPPSYQRESRRRYPVVYFLHGFGFQSLPGALTGQRKDELDAAMAQPGMQEFIVVEPSGGNRLGGSFYVNSPVTGDWETFISRELVSWVDKTFRTRAVNTARGIAGMSMGGYGCLNLAMRHPETFCATLSVCGGLLQDGALQGGAMPTWDATFCKAYGAAFSPDLRLPYPHARVPQFDGSPEDQRIIRDWERGFGDFEGKIKAYQAKTTPLVGLALIAGRRDEFAWIPQGCEAFSKALHAAGIPHDFRLFEGGHEIPSHFVKQDFVPFFSKAFTSTGAPQGRAKRPTGHPSPKAGADAAK